MQFLESEISEFVECIWETTLGLPIERSDSSCEEDESKEPSYMGIVKITGTWSGTMMLHLDEALATRASAGMLGLPVETVEPADVQDVLGELINMIAGNIKALLPSSSTLSLALPIVVKGADYSVSIPGSVVASRVGFRSDGSRAVVALHQHSS